MVYNARSKIWMLERAGKTQIQAVMSFFHEESYIYERHVNHSTNDLDSSKSDLEKTVKDIHQVIQSQVTSIKASIEQSKIVFPHRFNMPHFKELHVFVSSHALDIIFKEYERAKVVGLLPENCGCQLRTSHGLPCAHEQAMYLHKR